MTSSRLALNRWTMGQVLMPAHFFALQDTLLQHVGLRARLQGLPGYGVARLDWEDALVAKGAVAVSHLTVVFASGELIDVPGNATISNLNLGELAGNRAAVYLHVLSQPDELPAAEADDDDPEAVPRLVHRVELSTRSWHDDARQSMKLAELERELGSEWRLAGYVPPLLQVGTSPFLRALIAEMERLIAHLQLELATQLGDTFLGQEHVVRLQRGQAAVFRLRAFLADCQQEVHLHPYFFFAALRDFYVEVCLLYSAQPEAEPIGYEHDDLAGCLGKLGHKIRERLDIAPVTSVRLPFVREEYYFIAGPFPDDIARARKVYLVIQHARGEEVSLDEVKLASPSRLEAVHSLALPGVTFERVTAPGFSHTFGGGARIYVLDHRGDEWQKALQERALCFYDRDELREVNAALSWLL